MAAGLYLWRTDGHPQWPVLIGVLALSAQALIRAPHARRAANATADSGYVGPIEVALLAGVSVGIVALPLVYLATPVFDCLDYSLPIWAAVGGAVLATAGLSMFDRSHRDLGEQWSASLQIGQRHRLVTAGVYKCIGHPMYAAIWS